MASKNSENNRLDQPAPGTEERFSWKSVLSGLFGSNVRETIADIRVIREGFRERKAAKERRKGTATRRLLMRWVSG